MIISAHYFMSYHFTLPPVTHGAASHKNDLLIHVSRLTVNAEGEHVLDNPDAIKNANNVLFGEVNDAETQRKKARIESLSESIENFDEKRLLTLTVPMLKTLAKNQKIKLTGISKKSDIVAELIRHKPTPS